MKSSALRTRGITGRKPGSHNVRKERELQGSINKHEKYQLDEYLRTRESSVDKDIKKMRSRIFNGTRDTTGFDSEVSDTMQYSPKYGELVHPRGNSNQLSRGDDLQVRGAGSPTKNRQQVWNWNL